MQRLRNRVEWLWRQLRPSTWFTRRKVKKVVTTPVAVSDEQAEPDTDRVSRRAKGSPSPQRRGKARGGPNRRRKKQR
jgi:hypothetical protein